MTVGEALHALFAALPPDERPAMPADAAALETRCTGVTHDSRRVVAGSIFAALHGLKVDGTVFVPEAVARGAVVVVAERVPDPPSVVPCVIVKDARLALALLATELEGHPSQRIPVIGITGTNGKTTTSYLVSAIVEAGGSRCGLMGTVKHRIGPRELDATRTTPEAPELQGMLRRMVEEGCEACVMEVSSHALALRRVDGVRFAAAVFTNLTRDHLDFHGDMERYFAAKRRLFEMLPTDVPAIVNVDDPKGASLASTVGRPVTYAVNGAAAVTSGPLSLSLGGLEFDVLAPQGAVHVKSQLVGKPNVYNILAAVATTTAIGVPIEAIERGVAAMAAVPGRFEVVSSAADDITVVVDYAHTDDALRNLLETARALARRRLITVFGAGGERDRSKRPLMGMVAARLSDTVVITSDNPRSEDPARIIEDVRRGADPERRHRGLEIHTVVDRHDAILQAIRHAAGGDIVLIAGKGHETFQEIDGRKLPFDDARVSREALEARRAKLPVS